MSGALYCFETGSPPSHHAASDVDHVLALCLSVFARPKAPTTDLAHDVGGMLGIIWAECIEAIGHRGEGDVRRLNNVTLGPLIDFTHVDNPRRFICAEQDVQLSYRDFRDCHEATLLATPVVA
jgi:hypothetical protein